MSVKTKIVEEAKSIFWTSLYFLIWFGALMLIKQLLLKEFKIEFNGLALVIIGALVVAKSVLILENVPLSKSESRIAIVVILKRTLIYLAGVFIILVLEKSFEGYKEYGGFFNALKNLANDANMYHIWVNVICVFGALFFYNFGSFLLKYLGKGGMMELLFSPYPNENKMKA
jgi:hypothetical protein